MKLFLDDREFDGQLQRTMTAVCSGSADPGELLATAARVTPGDYGSWFAEWSKTARRAEERARAALAAGHRVSAGRAFLRATEYWRQAIFFVRHDLDDPRLQEGWRAHRAAFEAALPLLPHETVVADVPFEGATLRAYFFRSNAGPRPAAGRPVVILPCGFDSTAEAGWASTAYMALPRGFDALVFEGPGQGGTLYAQRVPMRPDFEAPFAAVFEWLLAQEGIDRSRIAVVGRSFGGYLAPRAVTAEPRVAALVCDPGQYEFVRRIGNMLGGLPWERVLSGEADAEIEALVTTPQAREFWGSRMATQGARTPGEFLRLQPRYTLEGRAELVRCPVLLAEGEGDFASQGALLFEKLVNAPKERVVFPEVDGAGGHCAGLGATTFEETAFDWLEKTLGVTR